MAAHKKQSVRDRDKVVERDGFRVFERLAAIRRGLDFVYLSASQPTALEEHGSDFLWCLSLISQTSGSHDLIQIARKMGRELACRWRAIYSSLPLDADAGTILELVYASLAANRLGILSPEFDKQLRAAAPRFSVHDYLCFDAAQEPPPDDVPQECFCGVNNPRGLTICAGCGETLCFFTPQDVWCDALSTAYAAARYEVDVGAAYSDVLQWLPMLRQRVANLSTSDVDFHDTVFAITHVVYTLNDYNRFRLSQAWLPDEYAFLKNNLGEAIALDDPDMVGEFLDTLKSFGMADCDPLLQSGIDYLLSRQNEDGSWGDPDAEDSFDLLHATWTAIDGLRDYAWQGETLSFPGLLPTLIKWAQFKRC